MRGSRSVGVFRLCSLPPRERPPRYTMPKCKDASTVECAVLRSDEGGLCAFCGSDADDELKLGKFYAVGRIYCHHFCVLLSTCMVQKGKDDEGLLGFLLDDIYVELDRARTLRCSFCKKMGATLKCGSAHCKIRFHLPCGIKNKCLSLFYNTFLSFCPKHRPKQKRPLKLRTPPYADAVKTENENAEAPPTGVSSETPAESAEPEIIVIDLDRPETTESPTTEHRDEEIPTINLDPDDDDALTPVKADCSPILSRPKRKSFWIASSILCAIQTRRRHYNRRQTNANVSPDGCRDSQGTQMCPICMENVVADVTPDTLWPPCCGSAGDRWFHRECIERLALSAGQHYLKCPLCNDKSIFCNCMRRMGINIPDQDASWEAADTNWFESLYRRHETCDAPRCPRPKGPHTAEKSAWELLLCVMCAAHGCHRRCLRTPLAPGATFKCSTCSVTQSRMEDDEGSTSSPNDWQDLIDPQINFMHESPEINRTRNDHPKTNNSRKRQTMNSKWKRRKISEIHEEAMANLSCACVRIVRCDSVHSRRGTSQSGVGTSLSSYDSCPEKMDVPSEEIMESQVDTVSSTSSVMTVLDDIIELSSCHTVLSSSEESDGGPSLVSSTSVDSTSAVSNSPPQSKIWDGTKSNLKVFMPTQKFKRKYVRHKPSSHKQTSPSSHKQTSPSSNDIMKQLLITDYYTLNS